ncbi:MAG: hypothetical protein UT63_C0046G0004 [Candidatus Gottesmanbacteria bacterium GW2011_GWC2_39_8]|uniref:Glycosyltransferase RgtA/B/C/D-like domain-containing protein n=1 Tax=Candidatus Gottesmanbacteria bacterium GW2011_GWC2_39_8 TaxID=1618450 RepID=A0A0G0PVZ9_9BACT|nr:MAG: hypothetical protein UT63_C0046G0004 [Candidatus Gottesmanbacteria bacterium GW2011_GWC2_39_8]
MRKKFFTFVILFSVALPITIALRDIFSGSIPFWYDPARDLLLALDNLRKPTLIGPPTGIPGLFYGPYWLWLLSLILLVSRDPRFITLFVQALPYLILFPLLLSKFGKDIFGKIWILLWLFFFISYKPYITSLWNPNLVPLFFLVLLYLVTKVDMKIKNLKILFAMGFVNGLMVNFHVSFSLGIFIGLILFITINMFVNRCHCDPPTGGEVAAKAGSRCGGTIPTVKTKNLRDRHAHTSLAMTMILSLFKSYFFLFSGLLLTFVPFFLFEIRHGFMQIQSLSKTFFFATFYHSAVVGQTGLKPYQIVSEFFSVPSTLLHTSNNVIALFSFLIIIALYFKLKEKKLSFQDKEEKLLLFLFLCTTSVLFVFLSSKNPVWSYHFIGVEIIFILLIGILANKINWLKYLLIIWIIVLGFSETRNILSSLNRNPYTVPSLVTKEYIVDTIYRDAGNTPFSVNVYSPAIYTFDFDYLFKWKQNSVLLLDSKTIYLIIPDTKESVRKDFINYKTPDKIYSTIKTWQIPDGTWIVKRVRK